MKRILQKSYAWLVAVVMAAVSMSASAANFQPQNTTANVNSLNGTYDVLFSLLQTHNMPAAIKNASEFQLVDSSSAQVEGATITASIVNSYTLRMVVSGVADNAPSGIYKIKVSSDAVCLSGMPLNNCDAFDVTITFTNPNAGGSSKPIFPAEGSDYIVKNVAKGKFLNLVASESEGTILGGSPEILNFTYDDEHEAFIIQNEAGLYVGGHSNAYNMSSSVAEYWTVEEISTGRYALKCESGYLGFEGESLIARRNMTSSDYYLFTIEEPNYGVSAAAIGEKDDFYYGTYYADYAWYVPMGCKAYYVSSVAGGYANLTEVSSKAIASHTPVIIEAEESISNLPIMKAESGNAPSTNYLRGSLAYTPVSMEGYVYYKFSYDNNGENLGFYWDQEDGTYIIAHENKAYLRVPKDNASNGLKIRFAEEDATGINAIATESNDAIYNLQGQRVNATAAGIYVKNGKKFIVK